MDRKWQRIVLEIIDGMVLEQGKTQHKQITFLKSKLFYFPHRSCN
jgi:hypothetical protein